MDERVAYAAQAVPTAQTVTASQEPVPRIDYELKSGPDDWASLLCRNSTSGIATRDAVRCLIGEPRDVVVTFHDGTRVVAVQALDERARIPTPYATLQITYAAVETRATRSKAR